MLHLLQTLNYTMKLYSVSINAAVIVLVQLMQFSNNSSVPLVINTWPYSKATEKAWEQLLNGGNYIDAIEAGCSVCEYRQCDETVGYGGNTDENGESTLDAQIFDGATMDMGAVGGLRRIKNAIAVARRVLENTEHSILVGDQATNFAVNMGFMEEALSTNETVSNLHHWIANNRLPNFWKNRQPSEDRFYSSHQLPSGKNMYWKINDFNNNNHDTIGMIVIDKDNNIVAGTTTNGPKFKIPGRVGDSPLPGAGAYADNSVGAAVVTGNGDVTMRFLPSFLAVEEMRRGKTPLEAATIAVDRISSKYPGFFGAIIVVNARGEYAAACSGMKIFPMSVINSETGRVTLEKTVCNKPNFSESCINEACDFLRKLRLYYRKYYHVSYNDLLLKGMIQHAGK